MENRREIRAEELEQASGGFAYEGPREWLNGHRIVCPYCGCEDRGAILNQPSWRPNNAYFRCTGCDRNFSYHYNDRQGIIRFDDHGRGV